MHVFTYGSLMFPAVWQRVVRGRYRARAAVVEGHARFAIAGETYPAIVMHSDRQVEGVLYFDVAPDDVAALDAFEGPEYRRVAVQAKLDDGGGTISAQAYLYLRQDRLAASDWQPEHFDIDGFIEAFCPSRDDADCRAGPAQ